MYKNLKIPTVECLENGNYHVYRKLFLENNFFQMDPCARKLQESGTNSMESKKINRTLKLCRPTLATNNLILS